VYKIPRATACQHCMRLHLNSDGSPRKYKLKDVAGNSNIGLPAFSWQFVIGPVHPYCYCLLYRELERAAPSKSKKLAQARRDILHKTADGVHLCDESCSHPKPDVSLEHVGILMKAINKVN